MLMRTSALLARATSDLQHTIGHLNCPACEAAKAEILRTTDLKELLFKEAALVCLDEEVKFTSISPRTHQDHRDFTRRLNRFFGEMRLKDIHAGNILCFQSERAATCGPEAINHEVSWLSNVLDKAGLWKQLKPLVTRLHVPESEEGVALTPEKEELLVTCAASDPRWHVAYICTLLTLNTGAHASEIRHTRVRYIDLRARVFQIKEGVKNEHRIRNFPFGDNETIPWICAQLLKRYYKICERQGVEPSPDHFVLPYLQTRNRQAGDKKKPAYDLTRPMASWRSAWESLREKAGLPNLRMYDLRHHAATKWMEDPTISEHTIEALMGQISKRMKKRYEHVRDHKKEEALEKMEVKPAPKIIETPGGGIVQIPALPGARPKAKKAEDEKDPQTVKK